MTTETLVIDRPDGDALTKRGDAALRMVQAFVVDSDETYTLAADELVGIKRKHDELEARRVTLTGPLNKVIGGINDLFRGPLTALKTAEATIKQKMLAYRADVERRAEAARQDAERTAQAERDRVTAEAEALRASAVADPLTGEIAQADVERIQSLELAAAVITPAPVVVAAPATRGTSIAKTLDHRVDSLLAFVRYVAENAEQQPDLLSLLVIDSVKMRARVKASGKALNFPGITVFDRDSLRQKV